MKLIFSLLLVVTPCIAMAASNDILISKNGVGPVNADTKATLKYLKSIFPSWVVVKGVTGTEGEITSSLFKVTDGNRKILDITTANPKSDKIFNVIVYEPKVKTDLGVHVESQLSQLLELKNKLQCVRGIEETQDEIICANSENPNIHYFLDLAEEEQGVPLNGKVQNIKSVTRKITRIMWKPPGR